VVRCPTGSKVPGFDPWVVPKSGSVFLNIYHYQVMSYVTLCLIAVSVRTIVNLRHRVILAPLSGSLYYCAKLPMLCYVHMMICVQLYVLSCSMRDRC